MKIRQVSVFSAGSLLCSALLVIACDPSAGSESDVRGKKDPGIPSDTTEEGEDEDETGETGETGGETSTATGKDKGDKKDKDSDDETGEQEEGDEDEDEGDEDEGDEDEDEGDDEEGDESEDDDDDHEEDCVRTQGFWKNHSAKTTHGGSKNQTPWPISEDTELCGKTWYDILQTPPSGGDAWYILAHQWIAASLNVASGAGVSSDVQAALDAGKTYLEACEINSADRSDALAQSELLDAFNNGNTEHTCPDDGDDDEDDDTTGDDTTGDDTTSDTCDTDDTGLPPGFGGCGETDTGFPA